MDWVDSSGKGDGYTAPSEIAKKIYAERESINSRTKLTWNKADGAKYYSTDKMLGEINLSAPYMRIGTRTNGKFYWIQNCNFYLGNGTPTTIEAIEAIEAKDPIYGPELMDTLYKAEEVFLKDASKRDDALCKICVHYRSKNHEDYLRHIMNEHPDHAMKVAGILPEQKPEPVAVPVVTGHQCSDCGKSFDTERALGTHKRFSKTNHGA
jgi:hypothetical protein